MEYQDWTDVKIGGGKVSYDPNKKNNILPQINKQNQPGTKLFNQLDSEEIYIPPKIDKNLSQDIQFKRESTWKRVDDIGITMYWATVCYFQKTAYTQSFFDIVKHVKENWPFYKDLYNLPGSIYRNDYSFSVAAHVMNGFQSQAQPQLPIERMYKTFDWTTYTQLMV